MAEDCDVDFSACAMGVLMRMEKRFATPLAVPKVWKSLIEIESFDDLTAFFEQSPPTEALGTEGLTQADWPRPIRHDRREVSFQEDGYTVTLELRSGNESYFTLASVTLPSGDRYAHTEVGYVLYPEEILEIRGMAKFVWKQQLV
jgi:hypothetical protein